MITAFATTENAIQAMKLGAYDYVPKPFKVDELKLVVAKALEQRALVAENRALRHRVGRVAGRARDPRPLAGDRGGARARREGRARPHDRCSSPARAARARRSSRARSTRSGSARPAVRGDQLRRDPREAPRERALRAREGQLHRRRATRGRACSRSPATGHALPRRGRRAAAAAPGEAPARAPGAARSGAWAASADLAFDGAHRRGDEPRPRRRGAGRALPRGPLLPAERHPDPDRRRCASAARTSRSSSSTSSSSSRARAGRPGPGSRAEAERLLARATTTPATCASSRTSSSAR